ncbi:LPXTG cell wall anchor domain-containing protein [Enterococcus sp. HY326]|uniref:LPXTG cell wall anchor domain-containing protein n=1 Tax=Enterococcus sp. HY326 TaxID=2971265 RepID=UPI002240C9C5|nr:LPXTG cell wall anchor domain-containing protein [Enterococcus sp. HY326]
MVIIGVYWSGPQVLAAGDAGGQVQVDGQITFYEDSTEPSSTTSESSSLSTSTTTSEELPSTGGGKLPNTGETVRNFSLIGGGVILLALLFFLYRRKRENEKEGQA